MSLGLGAIRMMPEEMGRREASSSGVGAKTPWYQLGALRSTDIRPNTNLLLWAVSSLRAPQRREFLED